MGLRPPKLDDSYGNELGETLPEPEPAEVSSLPVRRRKASRDEVAEISGKLDFNVLKVISPSIADQLDWRQERWLVMRLLTHSDRQACLNSRISLMTVNRWKSQPGFATAYNTIILDPINFQLLLTKIGMIKATMKLTAWMDHPNLSVQMKAVELALKSQAAQAQIEIKKNTLVVNGNMTVGGSQAEMLRLMLESGMLDEYDTRPRLREIELPGTLGLGTSREDPSYEGVSGPSSQRSQTHQDQGRERLSLDDLRSLGLATSGPDEMDGGEVLDSPEGETVGDQLAPGLVRSLGSELPSEQ